MTSAIKKRSIVLYGHKTSISMEPAFWTALCELATRRSQTLGGMVEAIDKVRSTEPEHANANLSSAVRVYLLQDMAQQLRAEQSRT